MTNKLQSFEAHESNVRAYCRKFPSIFVKAKGHIMWDEHNKAYIDFMSGSGALNYGHNNEFIQEKLIKYILDDGITHSLDLHTQAKYEFIDALISNILTPRKLNYKIQFTGPTGSNSVEAALKIARKVTKCSSVVAFTNGFHGTSLGALATTGNKHKRTAAGVSLNDVVRMPYDGYLGEHINTIEYIESVLNDPSSGIEQPAAFIVESIQAEGGVIAAQKQWLLELQELARRKNILLILDDIQTGCGRTGKFFSFEEFGLYPDIICLSKSISGYGLPMALILIKPELDIQKPGEHSGTFRGNNHAFITAKAAISLWNDNSFLDNINTLQTELEKGLNDMAGNHHDISILGRGLLKGIKFMNPQMASDVSANAFVNGLITETSGGNGQVLKLMPPLTTDVYSLQQGLDIINKAISDLQ